jgi:hypothetical protein
MASISSAEARIDIAIADTPELAAMLKSDRGGEVLLRGALETMLGSGTLVLDGLRRRPRFFDGRFLTGADLTRDQDYVRQRQADMARAGGSGVITGLLVSDQEASLTENLTISAGHGITASGDLVMLREDRDIPLMDLPVSRMLDAAMGLSVAPNRPLSSRSGVFILGLRPVEFTANPIAAYPRSITGQAAIEDGDIIEASAVTIIPWPDMGGAGNISDARRAVARQIFGKNPGGIPANILPLAMLGLDGGNISWIDTAMVRREIGADSGIQVALGSRPRALAEAHLLQHRAHVQDVMADLVAFSADPVFSASKYFSLLPPAGLMPIGAVQPDATGFQQVYFPPAVDVDIAFIPADEIAALVEESLCLPPIDLDASAEDVDATGIVILIPVNRQRFQRFTAQLGTHRMAASADPSLRAKDSVASMLDALMLKQRKDAEAADRNLELAKNAAALAAETANWHTAFAEAIATMDAPDGAAKLLWYVRRRAIAYRTNVEGLPIAVSGDDIVLSSAVNENLAKLGLEKRLAKVNAAATPQAAARVMQLLGSPRIARSDIMTASVIADLEKVAGGTPEAITGVVREDVPVIGTGRPGSIARGGTIIERPISAIRLQPLDTARAGAGRISVANMLGRSTAARADTSLGLSESEVFDLASDYGGIRLGEGIAAIESHLGEDWPDKKQVVFLGDASLGLPIDAAFQSIRPEVLKDRAFQLADLVKSGDAEAIQKFLKELS